MIRMLNMDCMDFFKTCGDKQFDLILTDPPYGIDVISSTYQNKKTKPGKQLGFKTNWNVKNWDKKPITQSAINQIFRVSASQIIFGANHFISKYALDSSCWIVWDKDNGENDFADCELAWTSFQSAIRKFKYKWHGMLQENMIDKETRIHPCHKPVALFKWILQTYAKPGWTILDPYAGSFSSAIACHDLGYDYTGIELDKDYYNMAVSRYQKHAEQGVLFTPQLEPMKQMEMFNES